MRRTFVLAILVLVAGIAVWILGRLSKPELYRVGGVEVGPVAAGTTVMTPELRRSTAAAAVPADAASESEAGRASGEAPQGKGTLQGWLYDLDSQPLPRWKILLMPEGERWFGGTTRHVFYADATGWYETRPLVAGTYRAYFQPFDPTVPDPSVRDAGTVEVVADQARRFDFVLTGDRTLSGIARFVGEDADGVVFQLVLLRTWPEEEVVARGEAVTWERPPWGSAPPRWTRGEQSDSSEVEEEREDDGNGPVMGKFVFPGLEAGPYVLRILLNDEGWHVELPVDLSNGDVELAPLRLSMDDFFREKLVRDAELPETDR